jgi:hypothetical protein
MALSSFRNFKFDGLDIGSRRRITTPESPLQGFDKFPLRSAAEIRLALPT